MSGRNYSLRFSLVPSLDIEKRIQTLLEFCEDAEIDDVNFFIAPEELHIGHITVEESKKYVDVILYAKSILNERGITVSLNPWITFAHWDGGRKLRADQPFNTMVGSRGERAQAVVCPLCENWRAYYKRLVSYYIETLQPRIFWIEDDFRLSNHEPVSFGCFCDEHMKLYNEHLGVNYDRETFVKKIFENENERKAYLDVARATMLDTFSDIINSTATVAGDTAFGLMTGGTGRSEARSYSKLFSVLEENGLKKGYNRICLCSYRQRGMQEYAWSINASSMQVRALTGNNAFCVSEMENFPHSMYTKSAHYLRYQLLSTAPLGFVGDTFSIFEFNGNGAVNAKRYARVLKEIKPYLSRLSKLDLLPEDMLGVRVLIHEKSSYTLKNAKDFGDLESYDGWLFAYLEQLGIACAYTQDVALRGKIVAVSGEVLRNFSKEEIIALFENNFVILTADNVVALKDLDLLWLIGAKDFEVWQERTGKHVMEEWALDDELCGVEKLRATAQYFCGDYYCIDYGEKPRKSYTHLLDYTEKTVGDGICNVNNALIFPYANSVSDQNVPIALICPLREKAIKQALLENAVSKDELFFVEEENVCVYTYKKETATYIVFVNFSDDDYEHVHFYSSRLFKCMKIFTPDNATIRDVSHINENGHYTINRTLKAQESYVLVCANDN